MTPTILIPLPSLRHHPAELPMQLSTAAQLSTHSVLPAVPQLLRRGVRLRMKSASAAPGPADVDATRTSRGHATTRRTILKGDALPMDEKVWVFPEGAENPAEMSIGQVLKGKRAVLFGLPGAYTSVCSSKHVPEYQSKLQDLKDAGVEVVACISVNDAYVMRKWAQDIGVDAGSILMLGDADASLHEALGLTQVLPGLGVRARRYSMFLVDGIIKVLNVEEPGGKSYKVSGPSRMLADLEALKEGRAAGQAHGGA